MAGQQPQRNFAHSVQPQRRSAFSSWLPMSQWSTAQVPNSAWADENFLLGAGMAVFQPATLKVVVVWEKEKKYWFLPKGRKDVGESLEQAALREAYEESGYRVEFLPVYTQTSAPGPQSNPNAPWLPNCEPIFINTASYPQRKRRNSTMSPGEYLTFWYIGQIPADAVREEGTGMPDEVNYETHLLSVEEATKKLFPNEARVVAYAWMLYEFTLNKQQGLMEGSDSGFSLRPASI
ncbi:NUDIX hydrolase domain-like protein [Mycena maculata]|uniref:NUDIX hydrolase domain-like protein n=1 Tax=Mycena maculata TaxID=230809 RepID=A0AAD7HYK4_9AGAR|nr:NUDIX hydrolase domain-like protein [Mycena maculata]